MSTLEQKLKEAKSLFDSRRYNDCISLCDKIMAEDDANKYGEAFKWKCKAMGSQMRHQEVLNLATEGAKVEPDNKYILYYQGVANYDLKRLEESLKYINRAVELYPEWDFPYYTQGKVLVDLGRYEEGYAALMKSFELDPTDAIPLNVIAFSLKERGKIEEAITMYEKVFKVNPEYLLGRCNRANLLSQLGRNKEALEDLKVVQNFLKSGKSDGRLTDYNMNFINGCLKKLVELDDLEKETEDNIKKADQSNPVVKKFVEQVKVLQVQKDKAMGQLISTMNEKSSPEVQKLMEEVERLKQQFATLNSDVSKIKTDVKKLESKYDEIKDELDNKMDDFHKKLDKELARLDISADDQAKLKDYFKAFIGTFSSIHVTSQVVDSGQVNLDSSSTKATLLSMVASFTPFIGNVLSDGIKSIGDFVQSREMKINARKMKALAADASELSQLIGKTGYEIVLNKEKQKQIYTITAKDMDQVTGNILEKVIKFCENLEDEFDSFMYTKLYTTPAARLGHMDANSLIEEWINEKINRYNIVEDFVAKTTTLKQAKEEVASEGMKKEAKAERSACCNMF